MGIIGLEKAPKFNGKHCVVESWDDKVEKWVVRINGQLARLVTENLAPCKVKLINIVKQPELNGTEVDVLGWDAAAQKWMLQLPSGGKARLEPSNVSATGTLETE